MSDPVSAELRLGAMVAEAALARSVHQFLEAGEEVRSVTGVRGKSATRLGPKLWNWLAISPEGVGMSKHMAVAVTSRRVLVLRAAGFVAEAREVAAEVPVSEVGPVELEVHRGFGATTATWSARGYRYSVRAGGKQIAELVRALDQSAG